MKINVGTFDRIMRFLLAIFLLCLGLFILNGMRGNSLGIIIASLAAIPLYFSITRRCIVFYWFNIHSLSKNELERYGNPFEKK